MPISTSVDLSSERKGKRGRKMSEDFSDIGAIKKEAKDYFLKCLWESIRAPPSLLMGDTKLWPLS